MKTLTFVVIVALYHVWIGMRDLFMDYIKPVGIRLSACIRHRLSWAAGLGHQSAVETVKNYFFPSTRKFDVVIVGAGGSCAPRYQLRLWLA